MRLLRQLLSTTLAILFILSPNSYGQGSVRPSRSEEALRLAVETMRSFQSFSDLVTDLKLKSPETAEKFSKYLKLNGIYGAKIPRLTIVGNSVVMGTNNEIAITLTEDDKFKVSWDKNHRILSPDMTFDEQIVAIESLVPKKTSFIIDLIITNAYAISSGLGVLFVVATFTLPFFYHRAMEAISRARKADAATLELAIETLKSACRDSAALDEQVLVNHHDKLSEHIGNFCNKGISEYEGLCSTLGLTRLCYEERIKNAATTINADRNSGKDIKLESDGRFRVVPRRATRQ
jgi:hypothetical protein